MACSGMRVPPSVAAWRARVSDRLDGAVRAAHPNRGMRGRVLRHRVGRIGLVFGAGAHLLPIARDRMLPLDDATPVANERRVLDS